MSDPEAPAPIWDAELAGLLDWFAGWDPPATPFALGPGELVIDAAIFRAAVERDICAGPHYRPDGTDGVLTARLRSALRRVRDSSPQRTQR